MANYEDGTTEFCPECPSRKEFLGEVSVENAHIERNYGPYSISRGGKAMGMTLSFVDKEGGQSDKMIVTVTVPTDRGR